jgi:hypothetical protein
VLRHQTATHAWAGCDALSEHADAAIFFPITVNDYLSMTNRLKKTEGI